ncbi:MAG: efflux RND transporter permease subunit [Gammaproteobacteria bacterium]|nr:efflux RND transporter permease subunit [Gammaproteobacteria bacterium]MDE0368314.1 efflux RND transporter permease subunit [Gammaproteobacteria bacterium]
MSGQPFSPAANPVRGGIIGWFAHNHVAANLLMFFIIAMGLYGAFNITVETFPKFEFDNIEVQVPYRGAAPAEVEEGVVVKIEEAIGDIEGIKQVFGYAREGSGRVSVEVRDGFDAGAVLDEVKLAVDSISTFPLETERPVITKAKFRREAITVQVSGDMDERDMKNLAERIRDEITALDEVSYAEVRGSRPFEISVHIPEITLRQYGLTLDQVALAIRAWSVDLPGGSIRSDGGDIRLRTKGQAYTGEEFEQIVLISREDGTRIRLGDIATIEDGFAETESYAFFNGTRSFGIAVMSTEDENELDVTAAVRAYVEETGATMPPGVRLETWGDVSQHLDSRMNMMFKNMFIGAVLVFAILGLFLHLKFAFWVIVGLPVAFLGALMMLPLPAIDISINVISLFGFILVLGIVVDDAIVVAESVYAQTEREGYSTANIVAGARRVAVPATFGVLTTIMAFLPMLFTGGALSAMTGSVGWVVVLCLAFSLVESKLILPSHLAIMRSSHVSGSGKGPAEVVDRWLKDFIERRYKPMLNLAIRHRYTTLALFLALLILTVSLVLGGKVRYVFFPEVEQDMLAANLELYDGAPESLVASVVERMNGALGRVNDQLKVETGTDGDIVKNVFAFIRDGRYGYFFVELAGGEEREVTPQLVEQRWRTEVGEIPGARELRFMSTMQMGGGPPVDFKLAGRDFRQLEQAAADLEEHLAGFDGVFEVQVSANAGPEEVRLAIKPEAEASGLTLQDLGRQVRTAFYGAEAQRIQRGDQDVRVMVRYPKSERQSLGNMEKMWVRTPDGRELPFAAVADYRLERGYDSIQRVDGRRSIRVTARTDLNVVEPFQVTSEVNDDYMPQLRARYPGISTDVAGSAYEERVGFIQVLTGFGIALFGIYALMAIPLRSYAQPLIIMGVIPFGIVGAVFGHLLLGLAVSAVSIMGIIALSGVVVNDSLIMVDFVNKAVASGSNQIEAAIQSGAARFRAILLTSLTTFFGLIPMVLETSMQAQIVIPMAVSVAFGILFATLITLVLVPSLYVIAGDVKGLFLPRRPEASATG